LADTAAGRNGAVTATEDVKSEVSVSVDFLSRLFLLYRMTKYFTNIMLFLNEYNLGCWRYLKSFKQPSSDRSGCQSIVETKVYEKGSGRSCGYF
jgi:hypothetical protein